MKKLLHSWPRGLAVSGIFGLALAWVAASGQAADALEGEGGYVFTEGPFGTPSEPFTTDWVEGPSALKVGTDYLIYFDHYASPHYYGAVRSKDLAHWEDCSSLMAFPKDHRHGTALRVSSTILEGLRRLDP